MLDFNQLQRQAWFEVHAYHPSDQEAEAGGSQTPGQPLLYKQNLFQKTRIKKEPQREVSGGWGGAL